MMEGARMPTGCIRASRSISRKRKEQVERLKAGVRASRYATRRRRPAEAWRVLLEEGDEVMAEGEEKETEAADLGLIAAAQKVEHYEISAYKTARTLAGQIGRPEVALLLNLTLGEEETAESLLTQIARELMSESRTGISKDDELTDAHTGSAKRATKATSNQR